MLSLLEGLNATHWLILAVLLGIGEVLTGANFFLLWCGMNAGVVGLALLIFPNLIWEAQFLIFGVGTFLSIFVWVRFGKPRDSLPATLLNQRALQYKGRQFVLKEPIVDGIGKIKIDDTLWKIEGPDTPAGSKVEIIGVKGMILNVRLLDKLD